MKDYLITLKLKSAVIKPIVSDQISGGLLYFLSIKDKVLFKKFYQGFIENKPPYIFSSLFPHDYLPINSNFLNEIVFENKLTKDESKKIKKISFIHKDFFQNIANHKNNLLNESRSSIILKNRRTMVSQKNETLYTEFFYQYKDKKVDVYLRVFEDFDLTLIDEFFSYFIGKKISSGFSNFEVREVKEIKIPTDGDYFINLSAYIPNYDEKDIYEPLYFDFFVKYPKLGVLVGGKNPFKKKIILVKEGSVFRLKNQSYNLNYFGNVLKNVSLAKKEAIQITLSFPYFFKL